MNFTIQNISKSFGGRDILNDFSLEVQAGVRLCVCGANGCGKSTFLRIVAGVEQADGGRVLLPKGCRLGYVEQELDESALETTLLHWVQDVLPDWNDFWDDWERASATHDEVALRRLGTRQAELEQQYGYNPEHRAKSVLSGLGFSEHKWNLPLRQLSGGWRERAKLARVLTAGADVLLLDEPTNHLDLEAVEWLESFLLDYKGALLFVAHDLVFMNKIGTHVLYLGGRKPLFRRGTFSQFVETQEELEGQREREAQRLVEEIERKMAFVRRFKAKATKARQAGSRQKMAKKLEKELEGYQPEAKRRELSFAWPEPARADKTILSAVDVSHHFEDGSSLWPALSFNIYRGQKIALVGPNGCGKSTLLKVLGGKVERSGGTIVTGNLVRMGFFSQHQLEILRPDGTVLGEIRRLSDPRTTEEELMGVLGLFMLGQSYFERSVGSLSGGEKSRLALAALFLARCNFLVLDEPTNHLDLESREALVEALDAFEGTILMVAHDRHLLSSVAEEVWALHREGITVYEDGFEAYDVARRAMGGGSISDGEENLQRGGGGLSREEVKRIKREQADARNRLYKELKPKQEAYAALEKEFEAQLAEQERVEADLADPDIYADGARATALLRQFAELQAKTESLFEQMSELEGVITALEAQRAVLSTDGV